MKETYYRNCDTKAEQALRNLGVLVAGELCQYDSPDLSVRSDGSRGISFWQLSGDGTLADAGWLVGLLSPFHAANTMYA